MNFMQNLTSTIYRRGSPPKSAGLRPGSLSLPWLFAFLAMAACNAQDESPREPDPVEDAPEAPPSDLPSTRCATNGLNVSMTAGFSDHTHPISNLYAFDVDECFNNATEVSFNLGSVGSAGGLVPYHNHSAKLSVSKCETIANGGSATVTSSAGTGAASAPHSIYIDCQ